MPIAAVTSIVANSNNTVSFFGLAGSTPVLLRSFGKVRNIRASENRQEIIISEESEIEFRFNIWQLSSLGSTPYTLINPAAQGAQALYDARFAEVFNLLCIRFFAGCCDSGAGDVTTLGFPYTYSSSIDSGEFYFTSGLLAISPFSSDSQNLSLLLSELPDGSWITFFGITADDYVVYEVSGYSLVSGIVFFSANIISGDSAGFAEGAVFRGLFDKDSGGSTAWGAITGTITSQADLVDAVQNSEWTYLPVTGTNTLTGTTTPALTAYQEGQVFMVKIQTTNTGAVTLNISGLGVASVTMLGSALIAGNLLAGRYYWITRSATAFEITGIVEAPTPNLQEVTDVGSTTTNSMEVQADGGSVAATAANGSQAAIGTRNVGGNFEPYLQLTNSLGNTTSLRATNATGVQTYELPESAGGTLAVSVNGTAADATGNITIPVGGLTWAVVTADATIAANTGVISNKAGTRLVLTLPTTAAVGDIFEVAGINATGWRMAQNASQMIHFDGSTSTTGTGGYIESQSTRDSVKVLCVVANLQFQVLSSVGTLTVN